MEELLLEQIQSSPSIFLVLALILWYVHKTFPSKDALSTMEKRALDVIGNTKKLFSKDIDNILEKLDDIKDDIQNIKNN